MSLIPAFKTVYKVYNLVVGTQVIKEDFLFPHI